jgi:hypothetical protein
MAFRRPGVRIPSAPSLSSIPPRQCGPVRPSSATTSAGTSSRPPLARRSTSAAAASRTPGCSRLSSHGPSSSPLNRHPPACPVEEGGQALAEDAVVLHLDAVDLSQLRRRSSGRASFGSAVAISTPAAAKLPGTRRPGHLASTRNRMGRRGGRAALRPAISARLEGAGTIPPCSDRKFPATTTIWRSGRRQPASARIRCRSSA